MSKIKGVKILKGYHCFFNNISIVDQWLNYKEYCEKNNKEDDSIVNFQFFCDEFTKEYNIDHYSLNPDDEFTIEEFNKIGEKYRYFWDGNTGHIVPICELCVMKDDIFTEEFIKYFDKDSVEVIY